jgi:hypothetical protein
MLMTSRMSGMGSGTTSPKMPPCDTKSATVPDMTRKWNGSWAMASGGKPAAWYATAHTGMRPLLRMTASVLRPMPTAATCMPGTRQLAPRNRKMSRYATTKAAATGRSSPMGCWPSSTAPSRNARATPRTQTQRRRRSARRGIPPPARAPATSASATTLRNIVRGQHRPRRLGSFLGARGGWGHRGGSRRLVIGRGR